MTGRGFIVSGPPSPAQGLTGEEAARRSRASSRKPPPATLRQSYQLDYELRLELRFDPLQPGEWVLKQSPDVAQRVGRPQEAREGAWAASTLPFAKAPPFAGMLQSGGCAC